MYFRLDEDVDAADAVEGHDSVFVFVAVTHPIEGAAVHVVFFVPCAGLTRRDGLGSDIEAHLLLG